MDNIPPEMKFDRGTLSIFGIERAQAGQLGCLGDEPGYSKASGCRSHFGPIRRPLSPRLTDLQKRGVVVIPIGAGKTHIAIAAMANFIN